MNTADVITACARDTQLPFLVIGGLAVIVHGYPRDTIDLDYLVRQRDRDEWRQVLARYGYEEAHRHENFSQFVSKQGWIDLDMMLVNDATFDGLFAGSLLKSVGPTQARFPSLEHLLALKLHVVKQDLPHRALGDMDDIVNLILVNRVNLREDKWRNLFQKYGTLELYEKLARTTQPAD